MKITDADHTNWRVKDLERSLHFYRDVLGLEPFGLEEYRSGGRPIVSLRVTPTFILHLRPDPEFEPVPAGGYNHLALVVEETEPETLARHLQEAAQGELGFRDLGVSTFSQKVGDHSPCRYEGGRESVAGYGKRRSEPRNTVWNTGLRAPTAPTDGPRLV